MKKSTTFVNPFRPASSLPAAASNHPPQRRAAHYIDISKAVKCPLNTSDNLATLLSSPIGTVLEANQLFDAMVRPRKLRVHSSSDLSIFHFNVRLTLVLPQLVWPEPEDKVAQEKLSCAGLEWLQAHGKIDRLPPEAYEDTLADLFGLGRHAPFGALRLLGESSGLLPDARQGSWLCADPVHLRFHQGRFILADAGAFDLSAEEASTLAACLSQEFIHIGQFHVVQTRRWYIRLNCDTELTLPSFSEPISAVAGRRIQTELPSWLNEVQMFLHSHPVNVERMAIGKPAINSLWLWGSGPLPQTTGSNYDGVWANDPVAIGLARASSIPTHPAPQQLDNLLTHMVPDSVQLVVLDDLLAPALYENSKEWREKLMRLDKNWFSPLRSALGKKVKEINLIAPTAYGRLTWHLNGNDRWKFWRHPKPLAVVAKELAQ